MNKFVSTIIILAILSGCAKITRENLPCTGVKPTPPIVHNMVGGIGNTIYIHSNMNQGTTILWSGPNNFSSTTKNGYLSLYISDTTNYGLYTAQTFSNGCYSDPDTFYLTSGYIGSPPCTIAPSDYNSFQATGMSTFQFSKAATGTYGNQCNYTYVYTITDTTTNNFTVELTMLAPPVFGYYYQLSYGCPAVGGAWMVVSNGAPYYNGGAYCYALSGNIYCNIIGGKKYLTLCDAIFRNQTNNTIFTMNGNWEIN